MSTVVVTHEQELRGTSVVCIQVKTCVFPGVDPGFRAGGAVPTNPLCQLIKILFFGPEEPMTPLMDSSPSFSFVHSKNMSCITCFGQPLHSQTSSHTPIFRGVAHVPDRLSHSPLDLGVSLWRVVYALSVNHNAL